MLRRLVCVLVKLTRGITPLTYVLGIGTTTVKRKKEITKCWDAQIEILEDLLVASIR